MVLTTLKKPGKQLCEAVLTVGTAVFLAKGYLQGENYNENMLMMLTGLFKISHSQVWMCLVKVTISYT